MAVSSIKGQNEVEMHRNQLSRFCVETLDVQTMLHPQLIANKRFILRVTFASLYSGHIAEFLGHSLSVKMHAIIIMIIKTLSSQG